MIVDAHQHFWKYDPVRDSWINDDMSILKKDFLPEELNEVYKKNKVDGCIAVQADQSSAETMFLLEQAEKHPFIKGVVGWIDPSSRNFREELNTYNSYSLLRGFRNVIQGEDDSRYFNNKLFQEGFSLLQKTRFTYDLLIYHDQLPAAIRFSERYPDQKFILDHCGKPDIKNGSIKNWKRDIRIIAENPNMYCKLSGLVTEADWGRWNYQQISPYLEIAGEYFGTDRLCFGSDWPVCLLASNYEKVLGIIDSFCKQVSEAEREQIFSGNAISFYQLS
jgi:L-fuconolactonase